MHIRDKLVTNIVFVNEDISTFGCDFWQIDIGNDGFAVFYVAL